MKLDLPFPPFTNCSLSISCLPFYNRQYWSEPSEDVVFTSPDAGNCVYDTCTCTCALGLHLVGPLRIQMLRIQRYWGLPLASKLYFVSETNCVWRQMKSTLSVVDFWFIFSDCLLINDCISSLRSCLWSVSVCMLAWGYVCACLNLCDPGWFQCLCCSRLLSSTSYYSSQLSIVGLMMLAPFLVVYSGSSWILDRHLTRLWFSAALTLMPLGITIEAQ